MRYADGGGYTPKEQVEREQVRLEAAERFERGEKTADVAAEFRVSVRRVEKWRKAWREGGADALRSKGPVSRERLTPDNGAGPVDGLVVEVHQPDPVAGAEGFALNASTRFENGLLVERSEARAA